MFETTGAGWILLAYTAGTLFGLWIKFHSATVMVIENLIENRFLKTRENDKGELEIIKYDEE